MLHHTSMNLSHQKPNLFSLLLIFGCVLAQSTIATAQMNLAKRTITDSSRRYKPDTMRVKKNFGHAALQFGLAELLPQALDQYVTKKDYAQISFKTISHNLN